MYASCHEVAGAECGGYNWWRVPSKDGYVLDVDVDVIQALVEQVASLQNHPGISLQAAKDEVDLLLTHLAKTTASIIGSP